MKQRKAEHVQLDASLWLRSNDSTVKTCPRREETTGIGKTCCLRDTTNCFVIPYTESVQFILDGPSGDSVRVCLGKGRLRAIVAMHVMNDCC